jgi:hypothetical protein
MDLGPVDHITADAVGEPGDRTFYIQARAGKEVVTVIVEKQQVQLLAASVMELLEDAPTTEPVADEATMGLQEPLDPRWRAGRLSIGFDQDRDLFAGGSRNGARVDPDLGVAGADAGSFPARGCGRRPGSPNVPVLREPDRRGGPRVSRDERALEAGLTDPAIPRVLATGELQVLGLLPNASNHTFLARARQEEEETFAVYKPRRGETPLWDFPEGTLCAREVATYVVARTLGWPNVPATVLRDGPFGIGSVQRFVAADPEEHYFTLGERFPAEFRRVAAFDLVVNNADRKAGHCLLGEDARIYVVDHGVCFSEEPKLRTVIWDFIGQPLAEEVRRDLRRLAGDLRKGPLREELANLLAEPELEALESRASEVATMDRFPEPGEDHRPFPWPPI